MNHGHIQTDYAHHHLEERQHARKAVPCLYVYLAASFQTYTLLFINLQFPRNHLMLGLYELLLS